MSREQWGHGYWKGVNDAITGAVKEKQDISSLSEFCIRQMNRMNKSKHYDKTLFPVRELFAILRASGIDDKTGKRVYDYILNNEPLGCYVTGHPKQPMIEDSFVLPNLADEVEYHCVSD